MTDLTNSAPLAIRCLNLPRLRLPKFGIGRAISEISNSIVQAFEMAYVAPFSAMQRKPSIVFDEDLEGRDPNW